MRTKRCSRCSIEKSTEHFSKTIRNKDGLKEWESRTLTRKGLLHIAEDMFLMGVYLMGSLAAGLYIVPYLNTNAEVAFIEDPNPQSTPESRALIEKALKLSKNEG